MDLIREIRTEREYAIGLRRLFHRYPEASPAEQTETMKRIESELDALGIPYERIEKGGVLARIRGAQPRKLLLMRSDIDALPIEEDPINLSQPRVCISENRGQMHACGHDAHIAMLLAAAKLLKAHADKLRGDILLVFEESEETNTGVDAICRAIEARDIRPDGCYATHVRWDIPTGRIGICEGPSMNGMIHFSMEINGATGHGSRPDLAKSALDCFHTFYGMAQTLRMKTVSPQKILTWSIGKLETGTAFNVIPDHFTCEGSVRFDDPACGDAFWEAFTHCGQLAAESSGCEMRFTIDSRLNPVQADPTCQSRFRECVEAYLPGSVFICDPWMASETFYRFSEMSPAAFCFIGIRNEAKGCGANHHTAQFDLDEAALEVGVLAAAAYALDFLR